MINQQLRYTSKEYKLPAYDICTYEISNPKFTYKSGNILVNFKTIESGVKIYVTGGTDIRNMTREIIPKNGTANLVRPYKISQDQKLLITVIPDAESYNTTYEFEYWTDATEKIPIYETILLNYENIDEKG